MMPNKVNPLKASMIVIRSEEAGFFFVREGIVIKNINEKSISNHMFK
jgi:hypothetical protein